MNPTISDQLFHFTGYDKTHKCFKPDADAFRILESILTCGYLRPALNTVKVDLGGFVSAIDRALLMVCLTETPIAFVSEHISKYGKFGLGFSIEWALKNGGLHVVYAHKDYPNIFTRTLSGLSDFFVRNGMLAHDPEVVALIAQLAAITEKFELRDEREWRFVWANQMDDGQIGIRFSAQDLETVICPQGYVARANDILGSRGFKPVVQPTEELYEQ